jgi:hypothetical protein
LVEDLLKGHDRPSTTLALVPQERSSVKVGFLWKAHGKYTRNREGWREKFHPSAGGPHMGVMGKQPERFQKTGNSWSPSVTFACYPPERLRY